MARCCFSFVVHNFVLVTTVVCRSVYELTLIGERVCDMLCCSVREIRVLMRSCFHSLISREQNRSSKRMNQMKKHVCKVCMLYFCHLKNIFLETSCDMHGSVMVMFFCRYMAPLYIC